MYTGVPQKVAARALLPDSRSRARPKSATLAWPLTRNRLAGLTSRCTTWRLCREARGLWDVRGVVGGVGFGGPDRSEPPGTTGEGGGAGVVWGAGRPG